jgi:hypothetical protein
VLRLIPNVIRRQEIDPRQLGWLAGRRAETRPNFPANRDYIDLRGFGLADLDVVLALERDIHAALASAGYDAPSVEQADRRQRLSPVAPMLDFGIASTVVALSALGCVPVMSCRGRSLGSHGHQFPAPMTTFYARKAHVPALLDAVLAADVCVVNSGGKLEVYSEDLRKMHTFACRLRDGIAAVPT